MAACSVGLLGRSVSILAAGARSSSGRAYLATGQAQSSQAWVGEHIHFRPTEEIPGLPSIQETTPLSAQEQAYLTGAKMPELNKKPVDEADAFVCKVGQRLLYGWWTHLRPDIPRLSENVGVEINATSFLLPLPEHIKPDPALAAKVAQPLKGRKEYRRQEHLNGGNKLNERFGKTETWKKIKQRLAQGYTLQHAMILHYYERYGAPKTVEERRVTLADIFSRVSQWDWILDRDMFDAQRWRELPTDEDFAGMTPEERAAAEAKFQAQRRFVSYDDYVKEYRAVEAKQTSPKLGQIPSWAEIEKMPEQERLVHTHAKTEYEKVFGAPFAVADKFFDYLNSTPAFMRKVVHKFMKQMFTEAEQRRRQNDQDPKWKYTGAAAQTYTVNPELEARYEALFDRLANPEKYDDYKDHPEKITNPVFQRVIQKDGDAK